jgi:hypothetical protein
VPRPRAREVPQAERGCSSGNADDHATSLVALVDVAVSFGDLLQRVPAIDHGAQLAVVNETLKEGQVLRGRRRPSAGDDLLVEEIGKAPEGGLNP